MPRIQFTIRGLLWATFWLAVAFSAWMADDASKRFFTGQPYRLLVPASLILAAQVASPLIAAGALFDRIFWGLVVGLPLGAIWLFYRIMLAMP